MTIIHTLITERPDTSTVFYVPSLESQKLQEEYITSGKIISRNVTMANNGLTRIVTTTFLDKLTYEQYAKDALMKNRGFERRVYNIENGLFESISIRDSNNNEYTLDEEKSLRQI